MKERPAFGGAPCLKQPQLAAYYENLAGQLPQEEKSEELEAVQDYNADLVSGGVLLTDPFDANQLDPSVQPYADLLNLQGDGAMGTLEIPAIGLNLVIYHGTAEEVLQDEEGLQIMRMLGRYMAYMIKSFDLARKNGLLVPEQEQPKLRTNFIR